MTALYDLRERTALITGGAQGIGFGIALELARAGSRVLIANRDLQKANSAAKRIMDLTAGQASALSIDVTDAQSVRQCVEAAIDQCHGIDVLVNNAGIHCENIKQVSTTEHFDRCLDVNLLGAWRVSQAIVPHFKARKGGRIINIASINGRRPWAGTPAYSASKAALINLTQSLAITLGADRINVNAVCPGGIITAMAEAFKRDRPNILIEIVRSRTLKRVLQPEDIGLAVVFFASSQAQHITGQSLNVDCGSVMS